MKKGIFGLTVVVAATLLLIGLASAKSNGISDRIVPASTGTISTVFIHSIEDKNGRASLLVDDIEWYEGEEANIQFREHEGDPDMQEAVDGYYIVNDSRDVHRLKLASNVQIRMQIYNRPGEASEPDLNPNESISLKQLIALFNQTDGLDMRDYPFQLTIQHGEVVKMIQQYVP